MRPHELRAARKALGLSQHDFGLLLGLGPKVPRRSIHDYEAGRTAIPGTVEKLVGMILREAGIKLP